MSWPTKLLIVGIPGMGKTTIGDYLRDKHGFTHIDMECGDNISKITTNAKIFIADLLARNKDIVMTWGFVPCDLFIDIVNKLGVFGFKKIWLDGNRNAARREFVKRDSQYGQDCLNSKIDALDLQMKRIEESKVVDRIKPKIVDTFSPKGVYRKLDDIINEIQND